MKFGYTFSNIFGTVYSQGNLVFTPDGNTVISPVGNRVSCFNLASNTTHTLPFETPQNIVRIELSPNGSFLLCIDVDGRANYINLKRKALLCDFNFKSSVKDVKFSPCGRYIAATHDKQIHVWRTPGGSKEFAPFVLHRKYTGHHEAVTCIDWSHDSKFFVTGSKDSTCRVYTLKPIPGYTPVTFTAHRDKIISVAFRKECYDIYSVSRDGSLLLWHHDQTLEDKVLEVSDTPNPDSEGSSSSDDDDDDEDKANKVAIVKHKWITSAADRHYFLQDHAKVICAVLHKKTEVLVVGFSNGVFGLYEMPDFNNIHTLSVSQKRITACAVNASGEWLAFGCAKLGQLLVWEWQSETYVLKQQSHSHEMTSCAYSPDGQIIATGGSDSKVKLWNTGSGFSVITFSEHTAEITGLKFTQSGMVVLSASLDGTVRAFDLVRYRNFRTFTSPEPTQFTSVAVDPSGELISAGCAGNFDICLWSMKTGRLLEMLSGHEGPVSGIVFSPLRAVMASSSWDGTVRVWDIFEHKQTKDTLELQADVVALSYRPDGRELCTSSLNGVLTFWDVTGPANAVGTIEGRKDIQGGRLELQRTTALNSNAGKCFTSVCYNADGSCLLAGGSTKYVCIYDLGEYVLLKRFCISNNRSLDGILDKLNSKDMTQAGPMSAINDDSGSDIEDRLDVYLPGVSKGDFSSRRTKPEIRTNAVEFSPTGRSWAAASTTGLIVYSLDDSVVFDPFDLDIDTTPDNVLRVLASGEYVKAMVMAFRLGEQNILDKVVISVPPMDVPFVAKTFPEAYLEKLLLLLGRQIQNSRHIEFYLNWSCHVLNAHGRYLKNSAANLMTAFRSLQKSLNSQQETLGKLCNDNKYSLEFLLARCDHADENAEIVDNDMKLGDN